MGQASSVPASSAPDRPTDDSSEPPRQSGAGFSRSLSRFRSRMHRSESLLRFQSSQDATTMNSPSSAVATRTSRLSRARMSFTNTIPNLLSRATSSQSTSQDTNATPISPSYHQTPIASSNTSESFLPHIQIPEIDLDFIPSIHDLPMPRTPPDRERPRPTSTISDRISSLRPDLGLRNISASLRRRRSPFPRPDDQTAVLSRILSSAAAATAASLMGINPRAAVSEMRQSGAVAPGEDGTFDGFLRSLQNGQLASALRTGTDGNMDDDSEDGSTPPLNFFRMFRFGTSAVERRANSVSSMMSSSPGENNSDTDANSGLAGSENNERMVPVLIVGIRSMNADIVGGPSLEHPFLDALSNFQQPTTPPDADMTANATLDDILRPPRASNRLPYRRRASMNGFNMLSGANDGLRRRRAPELNRSRSEAAANSESPPGPNPPPSTPADAGLSAPSSEVTTPNHPGSFSSQRPEASLPRAARTLLDATAEEQTNTGRSSRQSRSSESDYTPRFGSGNPRRNGVVEPDNTTAEVSRSWIIYVLGGTYPENHPILTTPSLFTDSPTHEDMLLLSSLLGPVKPPVATAEDVATAPGLFTIAADGDQFIAVSDSEAKQNIPIAASERCLICLSNYQPEEEARCLVKCGHLYHRECIDMWLTTGRNSCPLCRGEGVNEQGKDAIDDTEPSTTAASTASAAATDVTASSS